MKLLGSVLILLLFYSSFAAAESMDTQTDAIRLLNRAASKHRHQTDRPWPDSHSARLRAQRNSDIATYSGDGRSLLSIGNIYTQPGSNVPHSTTVVIDGPIIITGNK